MEELKKRIAAKKKISINYDRSGDVLYLALGKPVRAISDEDDLGLVYRFAMDDGRPCGVTVIRYKGGRWAHQIPELAKRISDQLRVGAKTVQRALESV